MKTNKSIVLVCALVFTFFLLTGCGGGSGGDSGNTLSIGGSSTELLVDTFASNQTETSAAVKLSAQSTPVAGSVTQGNVSNPIDVIVSRTDNKFTYQVTTRQGDDANYGVIALNDGIHDSFTPIGHHADADDAPIGHHADDDNVLRGALVVKNVEGGTLRVTVLADYEEEGEGDEASVDYLAAGLWLFTPTEVTADNPIRIAAFADGSSPFDAVGTVMALEGSAEYNGTASGIFVTGEFEERASHVSSFEGSVNLTANFGSASNLGTISGTIETGSDGRTINLGSADITESEGGFFTGDTTLTSGISGTLTGKWGGQFYGDTDDGKPEEVIGTFGGASADGAARDLSYLGFFGAGFDDESSASQ